MPNIKYTARRRDISEEKKPKYPPIRAEPGKRRVNTSPRSFSLKKAQEILTKAKAKQKGPLVLSFC